MLQGHVRRVLTLLLCAGIAVTMGGCRKDESEKATIKLGISPFQDTYLPILAAKRGWFKAEGLNVELVTLDWTAVQEALATGAVDVGINNISSVISTHAAAPHLVYAYGFNTFDDGFALMVRPNGPMKPLSMFLGSSVSREEAVRRTAAQLRGRTVITTSNTDMEQGVAAAARRGDLDFKRDVRVVNFPPADGLAAFMAGSGDAYIGGIPQRAFATRNGMVEMLTGADIGPPPINGFVTSQTFASTRRDDLLKMIRVWFRLVKFVNDSLDVAAAEMASELNAAGNSGFTADEFKSFWNKLEHYPSTPREVEDQILKPTGRNYWRARWDDCNYYFFNVTGRIAHVVEPAGVFIMPEVHRDYVAKYGQQ